MKALSGDETGRSTRGGGTQGTLRRRITLGVIALFALLLPTIVLSCSKDRAQTAELVGVAQQAATIGSDCDADSQCSAGFGAHSSCWTVDSSNDASVVRHCHCDRTYIACGNICTIIGSDSSYCGNCAPLATAGRA